MNKIGTMASIVDENGRQLTPEQVFALTVMFLRPRRIAVPVDTTTLIDDAFHGRLGDDQVHETDEDGYITTDRSAAAVCEAVASGAELGFYDGGIIYGNISMMPDGIQTAAVIAGMTGNKSVNRIVDEFPEYIQDRTSRDCPVTAETFRREIEERLPDIDGKTVVRDNAWRVDLDGGWFLVRLVKGAEPTIDIIAESSDRAYVIGLMEIAGDLVDECMKAQ